MLNCACEVSLPPKSPGEVSGAAALPPYAELHCLSNFTFLRGASHPHELVEQASALGYAALAITDECSVAGVVRAHVAAKRKQLKLLIGAEFRLECGLRFVALAIDRRGYGRLCRFITRGRRTASKGHYSLTRMDLEQCGLEQCFILWLPDRAWHANHAFGPPPKSCAGVSSAETAAGQFQLMEKGPQATFSNEQARWLAERFPGKVRIAVELFRDGTDHEHR